MKLSKQLKADLALLFVTIGWGTSFLLTKTALLHLQTYNFLAFRFIIAFVFSAIVFWKYMIKVDKTTLKYGIILGVILFSSYAFQTVGLNYTTASKSAFITGFNVVLVPLISTILMRKKLGYMAYVSVIMAFVGLAFLTLNQSLSNINFGDILTLFCAVITAFYIILAGKYTQKVESISFAIIQIGTVALLSLITSIATETPKMTYSINAWVSIVTLSVICTSGAFIIQMIAQKFTSPTHAALIFSGEPVFAAIFGFVFLGEVLGVKGTFKKASGKLNDNLDN
jgi:drug/metabolite transporter (DMT)-like permease